MITSAEMTGTCATCPNRIAKWNRSGYCVGCRRRSKHRPRATWDACDVCGEPIQSDNQVGVCKRDGCIREWRQRHWDRKSEDERDDKRKQWRETDHFIVVLRNTKQTARKVGVPHTLTTDDIPKVPDECPCCGTFMERGHPKWRHQPSLDKIVPALGYVPDNVQWLCRRCNQLKSNASPDELMRIALFLLNGKV